MRTFKLPKSKRGAWRQHDELIADYRRRFAGGGTFGFDYPTLRLNDPELYSHLSAIREAFASLPA